jgi:biotin carboxylase
MGGGDSRFLCVTLTDNHIINIDSYRRIREIIRNSESYFTDAEINAKVGSYKEEKNLHEGGSSNPACQEFASIYDRAFDFLEVNET